MDALAPAGLGRVSLAGGRLGAGRLQGVSPPVRSAEPPPSVAGWHVTVVDGKAIKRVAKRLKPLRGARGGVLGGRALVAQALDSGLVLAMHADPDGEANDLRFV